MRKSKSTDEAEDLWTVEYSCHSRWDAEGHCLESVNGGPETRRPDMDFGTPLGDLLIDPWIQSLIKERR